MNKILLIVLIIVIVALAGILVWQNYGKVEPIVNNQPPITDETANWKTYTNNQHGFIMKYPDNWSPIEITDSLQRQTLYRFQTPDGEIEFNVSRESYAASLEEYINSEKNTLLNADATNYILSEKKEIIVDGQRAIQIPDRGSNYETVLVLVKNDNFIYQIVFPTKGTGDTVLNFAPVNTEKAKVINQMFSTFKFTK